MLDELVLCAGWAGDQYCMRGADCLDDGAEEVLIFGGVSAAYRIGFVMQVSRGVLRKNLLAFSLVGIEVENARLVVIYPYDCMKMFAQDTLPPFPREPYVHPILKPICAAGNICPRRTEFPQAAP